jgi:hypothetical protein
MQTAKTASVVDNQSDGETNDDALASVTVSTFDNQSDGETNNDSLASGTASKDTIAGKAKDVVPPFSGNLDGIMWNDPLDGRVGNDLLCDRFISDKLHEKFPTQIDITDFWSFVIYSETSRLN